MQYIMYLQYNAETPRRYYLGIDIMEHIEDESWGCYHYQWRLYHMTHQVCHVLKLKDEVKIKFDWQLELDRFF